MRLYLIRHGPTQESDAGKVHGRSSTPLTREGRENIRKRAKDLVQLQIEAIITSPKRRAMETAQIILAEIKIKNEKTKKNKKPKKKKKEKILEESQLELFTDRRITERDLGALAGQSKKIVKKVLRHSSHLPEDIEERVIVQRRFRRSYLNWSERFENFLMVTHSSIYKAAIAELFGIHSGELAGFHLAYGDYCIIERLGDFLYLKSSKGTELRKTRAV
ncbi:MAG: histidine phosphatase family protein [Candidatus Micrarchaeota archaeon]